MMKIAMYYFVQKSKVSNHQKIFPPDDEIRYIKLYREVKLLVGMDPNIVKTHNIYVTLYQYGS